MLPLLTWHNLRSEDATQHIAGGSERASSQALLFAVSALIVLFFSGSITFVALSSSTQAPPSTLILTNRERLQELYGATETDLLVERLHQLAAHPHVTGTVVFVEQVDVAISSQYANWSLHQTDNAAATQVSEAIHSWVVGAANTNPNLRYVVLVGDDRVIPHRRLTDGTPLSEATYDQIPVTTTIGSALEAGFFLSDDYYGDIIAPVTDTIGLPELAVGRLVETPAQMIAAIDTFVATNGHVALDDALVTGYDVMQDAADSACTILSTLGPLTTDCRYVGPSWNLTDVDNALTTNHSTAIFFFNWGTHASIRGPSAPTLDNEAVSSWTRPPTGRVVYTMGDHMGLNVPPQAMHPVDWAEALLAQGSVYIASTGFTWAGGGVVYSEKLGQLFARELSEEQVMAIGDKLRVAKQKYVAQRPSINVYDKKVVSELILYGLPMTVARLRVDGYEPDPICDGATVAWIDAPWQVHNFHTTIDEDYFIFGDLPPFTVPDIDAVPLVPQLTIGANLSYCECAGQAELRPCIRAFPMGTITPGPKASYKFALRSKKGFAIIVAGRNQTGVLQTNINNVGNAVYKKFADGGYGADAIHFLATGPTLPGYDTAATLPNLQSAIVTTAVNYVSNDRPLTIYLIGHGATDLFYVDGMNSQNLTPTDLNQWLSLLESQVPNVPINIIIDTSNAASFILTPGSISKNSRLIIVSSTESQAAYASANGAYFSDFFVASLDPGVTLRNAFDITAARLVQAGINQTPQMDGDGDSAVNESSDFALADQRILFAEQASSTTPTNTPTPSNTPTPTPTPTSTPTATATPTTPPPAGDAYEDDDACQRAHALTVNGAPQQHSFHDLGDTDWAHFSGRASQSYEIEVNNLGADADAVIYLRESCSGAPTDFSGNAFGSTTTMKWNSEKDTTYYLEIQQFDPGISGSSTDYSIVVTEDKTRPAAPGNLRCLAINETTLGLRWQANPETDVTIYRITFRNEDDTDTGHNEVDGAKTYTELSGLTPNMRYFLRIAALDFSHNESLPSGELPCRPAQATDKTAPIIALQQPGARDLVTTTAASLTFIGAAQDAGNNLSRAHVKNVTNQKEGWDTSLSGGNDSFRVEGITLSAGMNQLQLTVFDEAGNASSTALLVNRLASAPGVALIVAGRNEVSSLQLNIYNAANRAYRVFRNAGLSPSNIHYLAPTGHDADGDGINDVDADSSPASVQQAFTVWAAEQGRLGPQIPFYVYLVDHGKIENFCVSGCNAGGLVSAAEIDGWLTTLESSTGVNQITVIIEACQSGSFIDAQGNVKDTISKPTRLVITSAGRQTNAYASAEGAYFSDSFFSCAAESIDFKSCFDKAVAAVQLTGVQQTPWIDDNGDSIYTSGDGAIAQTRHFAQAFLSLRPQITEVDFERSGDDGVLSARVEPGAEQVEIVWAAIYSPSFQEPTDVTLSLQVPVVRLAVDPDRENSYSFAYSNGFPESGDYRIVFYAQDRLGIHAEPRRFGDSTVTIYLPLVAR